MTSDDRPTTEIFKSSVLPAVSVRKSLGWEWALPLFMLAVLIGTTVLVWHLQRVEGRAIAQSEASADAARLANTTQQFIDLATRNTRRRWYAGHLTTEQSFLADVPASYLLGPSTAMISWVDANGICKQVVGPQASLKVGEALDDHWKALVATSQSQRGGACEARVDPNLGSVIDVALPGTVGRTKQINGGAIIFQIRLDNLLKNLPGSGLTGRSVIELSDGEKVFYQVSPLPVVKAKDLAAMDLPTLPVKLLNQTWQLRVSPTEAYVDEHVAQAPDWALWTWLAGTALLVVSVAQAFHNRKRYDLRLDHHLRALEKLAESSAAILGKVGAGDREVWQRLPEAASTLLDMAMASIAVLEEEGKAIRIVAEFGVVPPSVGTRFVLAEMPSAARCIDTRLPVTLEDIDVTTSTNPNRELVYRYQIRSALHVPLKVGENVIGIMMLADSKPRRFTASDIRLAELWGMLAAVAVANDRLYEQLTHAVTTRDRLLQQREAVFSIVNELITQHGSVEQILESIAELAPDPLEVDLCQVALLTENPGELIVAASTRKFGRDFVGCRYPIKGSGSGRALAQKSVFVVEEGGADSPDLYPTFRNRLPCGSAAFVPMKAAGGETIGLLVMLRGKTGPFSEDQIGMGQLLAVRAAAAIENARLYERTRQDADAKTMLLRELNHRVKNNLAGIVALLSIDQPELSPRARQWLNRVTDRVRTLARTQEMLAEGFGPVTLRELIDHTMRSLQVVVRPTVKVGVEVNPPDVRLRNDRAVSVAMVLHELCYNALVHGLSKSGKLLVKASLPAPHELMVEVIDDGCGFNWDGGNVNGWEHYFPILTKGPEAAEVWPEVGRQKRNGAGLNLVRDFVDRELRGKFSVISSVGKGTTARVEFTLLTDEWNERGL